VHVNAVAVHGTLCAMSPRNSKSRTVQVKRIHFGVRAVSIEQNYCKYPDVRLARPFIELTSDVHMNAPQDPVRCQI